ncbi:hypothetical protein D3C72_2344450 [compost metagenome]
MLEAVDALVLNDGLHLVENLFTPPGNRHVERVITVGARGLVVPTLQCVQQ